MDKAEDKARSLAEDQKDAAADRLDEVGQAVDKAAEALEREVPAAGPYVRMATDGLRDASAFLRASDVDDLLDAVRDTARRYPVVFFGGTILAGLVAARFLKSSAARREAARLDRAYGPTRFEDEYDAYPMARAGERSGSHG